VSQVKPLLFAIPMKDPSISKSRLSMVLDDRSRREFALAMFERTLDVVANAADDSAVLVITESRQVEAICKARGINTLVEDRAEGINEAARKAASWAAANGFERMAILPMDLPLLSSADLVYLQNLVLPRGHVALCESVDGGTNCLMVSPPDAMKFQYGEESFRAHRLEAMRNGLVCHILRDSNIRFDLDSAEHLQEFSQIASRDKHS